MKMQLLQVNLEKAEKMLSTHQPAGKNVPLPNPEKYTGKNRIKKE
jgi:hypothetical protein